MIVMLLTVFHLEFLSLTEGCRGSFKSTLAKMPNCLKSHAAAQIVYTCKNYPLPGLVYILFTTILIYL